MEPKPQPGRNIRGEFITNDATGGQVSAATIELVEMLTKKQFWHGAEQQRVDELLVLAKGANEIIDAGERPATEDTTE